MAFVPTIIANSGNIKGRGLKFDGYAMEVHAYAKDTGDTTGTITANNLRRIHNVYVFGSNGAAIAAGVTITNKEAGFDASAALTSLGAGTSGVVVLKGSEK